VTDEIEMAERFEGERPRLRGIAMRMLGSSHAADDAVQEAWLRLVRTDARSDGAGEQIENLPGWLTTVVSRICLDVLRSRTAHREEAWPDETDFVDAAMTPEEEVDFALCCIESMFEKQPNHVSPRHVEPGRLELGCALLDPLDEPFGESERKLFCRLFVRHRDLVRCAKRCQVRVSPIVTRRHPSRDGAKG